MHEVVVTALPHPISMFFLGVVILGMALLYIEFKSIKTQLKSFRMEFERLSNDISNVKVETSKSITDISRKVDSRIDKALGKK
jgi:hypothetical protein